MKRKQSSSSSAGNPTVISLLSPAAGKKPKSATGSSAPVAAAVRDARRGLAQHHREGGPLVYGNIELNINMQGGAVRRALGAGNRV